MKKSIQRKALQIGATLLLCVICLVSCGSKQSNQEETSGSNGNAQNAYRAYHEYSKEELRQYIQLEQYIGLTIELSEDPLLAGEEMWEYIVKQGTVLKYPEDHVAYYIAQTQAKYRYYARQNEWEYEETLAYFNTSETAIAEEARQMVKEDLVFWYIVKDAEITLTEDEKQSLFERYVNKFSEDYGYSRDYVTENMTELIYETMLYDKTLEYLMLQNHVLIPDKAEQ